MASRLFSAAALRSTSRRLAVALATAGGSALAFSFVAAPAFSGSSFVHATADKKKADTCPHATRLFQSVYNDIAAAMDDLDYDDGSYGPVFLRLAWHAAGTYDAADGSGGSKGATMRFSPEADHGANAGLAIARARLEAIKAKYGPMLSYADLWSLAGVAAIQELGGPTIPWRPGRVDAPSGAHCTPDGRLPPADGPNPPGAAYPTAGAASGIRCVFHRMGMTDQEIVALAGAHVLGRCHTDRSGYSGPWTRSPTTFSNEYFVRLVSEEWVPKSWSGPLQYENKSGGDLMMLPADIALLQDPKFKPYVELYAKDQAAFFRDFTAAYVKLAEQGVPAFATAAMTFSSPSAAQKA